MTHYHTLFLLPLHAADSTVVVSEDAFIMRLHRNFCGCRTPRDPVNAYYWPRGCARLPMWLCYTPVVLGE